MRESGAAKAVAEDAVQAPHEVVQLDCGCRTMLITLDRLRGPGDEVACPKHGEVEVVDVLRW